ncbi:MAG: hypothetical protein ACSLFH_16200 [Desulfuromonadales bacterium]
MKRLFIQCAVLMCVVTLFVPRASSAKDSSNKSSIILPEGVLEAPRIGALFSGRTVVATIEGKDRELVFFFGKDGQLIQVRNGWQEIGSWNVRDDGRLCTDLEGSGRDCRIIVKQGGQYQQYAVKKDGNHSYELTYGVFQEGNHLAKLSKDPLLPAGTLSSEELMQLFSGQTVESVTAEKGRVSQTYYNPDGTLEQRQGGEQRFGKWRVTNDARICLQMEDLQEKCRIIVKEKDEVRKYIVKKNGQHQHSVSYRKFSPGKTFK